jgi:hypothetical protein
MYLFYGRYGKEAKINPEKACKNSPVINLNLLDSLVWHLVKEREMFETGSEQPKTIAKMKQKIEINYEKINNCKNQITNIEKKRERNNTIYYNDQMPYEKYISNSKQIDKEVKEFKNLQTQYDNENKKHFKFIEELERKDDYMTEFANKEEYLNNLNDVERQLLVQKYISEINIFDDVPNTTKIVFIHYDNLNCDCYRIHIKKRPYLIEYDHSSLHEEWSKNPIEDLFKPTDWIEIPIRIENRFERKKEIKQH